jgi:molecular chaperone DnaK
METIIGIDLGTTNSEVAVVRNGIPEVLGPAEEWIMPSVVGIDREGQLLVGKEARNQWILAPERTIRSIKRKMGEETTVSLGGKEYTPQEISAIILRTLKARAEKALGEPVYKAVITVPAWFNDGQRRATREAGELAGLEVALVLNEPTAAALTYDSQGEQTEHLLVYDLGGGTFDVSVVRAEKGVVEVLASRGDTQLGGDDFDLKLVDWVCEKFQNIHGIDLRDQPATRSRVWHAVEEAKKRLSFEPVTRLSEEFIASKKGVPLHLDMEIRRSDYDELIGPLVEKTLTCVNEALADARLDAETIDKVVMVGGMTRTPLIHESLAGRLGRPIHGEVEPDLCVALGASLKAGLMAGLDVGPVLVDITPRTLGISCLGEHGLFTMSPVITRHTALPAVRTEMYYTCYAGQPVVRIAVHQGEEPRAPDNDFVGEFILDELSPSAIHNEILVRFELDQNGILKVSAIERATGRSADVVIDNAMERFRRNSRSEAYQRVTELMATMEDEDLKNRPADWRDEAPGLAPVISQSQSLKAKADQTLPGLCKEDQEDLASAVSGVDAAIESRDLEGLKGAIERLENLLFYLQDSSA